MSSEAKSPDTKQAGEKRKSEEDVKKPAKYVQIDQQSSKSRATASIPTANTNSHCHFLQYSIILL
jgi:hypothetical protein